MVGHSHSKNWDPEACGNISSLKFYTLISRPGQSQGLLYNAVVTKNVTLFLTWL